jgi:hypothetical protein
MALSTEDLAALLFGSIEVPAPVPPAGAMADLMGRLFPIPLPVYGLNYT